MFNRFTERARKVIVYAKEEARRFNHDYIGTEHLLLGLVREGEGVAAAVLQKLGLDLETIRMEVEKLVQPGPQTQVLRRHPVQLPVPKKRWNFPLRKPGLWGTIISGRNIYCWAWSKKAKAWPTGFC